MEVTLSPLSTRETPKAAAIKDTFVTVARIHKLVDEEIKEKKGKIKILVLHSYRKLNN